MIDPAFVRDHTDEVRARPSRTGASMWTTISNRSARSRRGVGG